MINTQPKVTILMPVYNGEDHISEAIESIIEQTFTDFELLVINDGSSDGTLNIIENYIRKDQRIRVVSRENRGLVSSLNEGIGLSVGSYIARLDADDISFPDRIERQVRYMDSHCECGLLGGGYESIDEDGNPLGNRILPLETPEDVREYSVFQCPFAHSSVMIRMSTLEEFGFFYDEEYYLAEDHDLWCRMLEKVNVHYIRESLVKIRENSKSITNNNKKNQLSVQLKLVDRNLKKNGVPLKDGFYNLYSEKNISSKYPEYAIDLLLIVYDHIAQKLNKSNYNSFLLGFHKLVRTVYYFTTDRVGCKTYHKLFFDNEVLSKAMLVREKIHYFLCRVLGRDYANKSIQRLTRFYKKNFYMMRYLNIRRV